MVLPLRKLAVTVERASVGCDLMRRMVLLWLYVWPVLKCELWTESALGLCVLTVLLLLKWVLPLWKSSCLMASVVTGCVTVTVLLRMGSVPLVNMMLVKSILLVLLTVIVLLIGRLLLPLWASCRLVMCVPVVSCNSFAVLPLETESADVLGLVTVIGCVIISGFRVVVRVMALVRLGVKVTWLLPLNGGFEVMYLKLVVLVPTSLSVLCSA